MKTEKIVSNENYKKMTEEASKNSPLLKNCLKAFFIGGLICTIGQILYFLYETLKLDENKTYTLVSITLIFISSLLTGLGLFEKIAKHAGAGTLVPITGFSNAVTSPALEFKSEGFIMGLGAKMFLIAGPVIVYSISASIVYGIIYYVISVNF